MGGKGRSIVVMEAEPPTAILDPASARRQCPKLLCPKLFYICTCREKLFHFTFSTNIEKVSPRKTAGQEGRISETTQMKLSFMLSCMLSFLSFSPMSLNGKILILYLQGGEVYTSISPSLSTRVSHPHVEIFFPIMILAPCSTKNILTA